MNHSEEMKLMYYHFSTVALGEASRLVSLIKYPEHVKFGEAASSQLYKNT